MKPSLRLRVSHSPKSSMGNGIRAQATTKHIKNSATSKQPFVRLESAPKTSMGNGLHSPAIKKHLMR